MVEYYYYVPCPGSGGFPFYSNIPIPPIAIGNVIKFSSLSPDAFAKLGVGTCYQFSRILHNESISPFPSPFVSIDWDPLLTTYSTYQDCTQCSQVQSVPCGNCPPGFQLINGDCIQETTVTAQYSGTLTSLVSGQNSTIYGNRGLRLYPDITGLTFPLVGVGSDVTFQVKQNNGAGAVVIPLLPSIQNKLWGSSISGCTTGSTEGRLNLVGLWNTTYNPPGCISISGNNCSNIGTAGPELPFEVCINITEEKQYLIGLAADNEVKLYIDSVLTVSLENNTYIVDTGTFNFWHVFPITLTAGSHTIKLAGINLTGLSLGASFGAEIYDMGDTTGYTGPLDKFQSLLCNIATGASNCGNTVSDIIPYILFTTQNFIGSQIAAAGSTGTWSCPDGSEVDYCNGIPSCKITNTAAFLACGFEFVPCCGGPSMLYEPFNGVLTEGATYYNTIDHKCYTVYAYKGSPPVTPFPLINVATLTLTEDGCNDLPCKIACNPCECYRVRYTGVVDPEGPTTETMYYMDCDFGDQNYDIPLDGSWGPKVCMKYYELPDGEFEIVSFGYCELNSVTKEYECPTCYKLTDCDGILDPIYTLSPSIGTYIQPNQVIQIEGSDACWIPSISDEDCACAVSVNVMWSYSNCDNCKNPKGYKLTNCTTDEVIYTNQDLSDYVGKTVELECGGCWIVEALDLPAPNTQPVTILSVYDDCLACNGGYYILEDCAGLVDSVITTTDLSAYVGKVIKLKYCPETCWTVSTTTIAADAGIVLVDSEYTDCPECYLTFPCICTKVTNSTTEDATYTYYDCDGNQQTVDVKAGETSSKVCALVWTSSFEPNDCECLTITTDLDTGTTQDYTATQTGYIINGQPEYTFTIGTTVYTIHWYQNRWIVFLLGVPIKIYLFQEPVGCPIGKWTDANGQFSSQLCPPVPIPFTGTLETFGECINGICPRPVFPKRQVKPGYNTPTCTPDKYEKIVCNFSEWMYKDVLEQRYGISNCCPEELIKWEIKKEILDLEVLVNPDYNCQPSTDCCTPIPNVPTGSCNSQ